MPSANYAERGAANRNWILAHAEEQKLCSSGDVPRWGLAMSGGGIRSAAFNVGVLKGLYDEGLLDSIKIISSVSGGGYALYWLYSNYYHGEGKKFGYRALDQKFFNRNVCVMQNYGNTYQWWTLAFHLALYSPSAARDEYQQNVCRSFGNGCIDDLHLGSFNASIKNGDVPYFIMNATISSRKKYGFTRVYEFTGTHLGNPDIHLSMVDSTERFSLAKAMAISGAAMKQKWGYRMPKRSHIVRTKTLYLYDGGGSENLGAIALIRRGVRNIIIIDAEHNNRKHKYGAYTKLKHQLKVELDLNLSIPTIDSFLLKRSGVLATSVHYGEIDSFFLAPDYLLTPLKIKICYIKMALSKSMTDSIENEAKYTDGERLFCEIEKVTREDKQCSLHDYSSHYNDGEGIPTLGLNSMENLSVYWVRSYRDVINKKWKLKMLSYTFPNTKTIDQSFYRNQCTGFVGLGYLHGKELRRQMVTNGKN